MSVPRRRSIAGCWTRSRATAARLDLADPVRRRPRGGGFTVIELLVAAAITAMLVGLMLGLAGNVLRSWNRSHGALTTEAQARVALDQLARDLQGAMYRHDGGTWLAVAMLDDADLSGAWRAASQTTQAKPAVRRVAPAVGLEDTRFGLAGAWLRLITSMPTATRSDGEPGGPVAISYQVIRRRPGTDAALASGEDDDARYGLYRTEIAPKETFHGGYHLNDSATGAEPAGAAYLAALKTAGRQHLLADGVIDFGVRCYVRDGPLGTLVVAYPTDDSAASYFARAPADATGATGRFPAVADVMIRVLTEEGARQILLLENGQITGDWWTLAAANSKVFTRRVALQGGMP